MCNDVRCLHQWAAALLGEGRLPSVAVVVTLPAHWPTLTTASRPRTRTDFRCWLPWCLAFLSYIRNNNITFKIQRNDVMDGVRQKIWKIYNLHAWADKETDKRVLIGCKATLQLPLPLSIHPPTNTLPCRGLQRSRFKFTKISWGWHHHSHPWCSCLFISFWVDAFKRHIENFLGL